MAGLPAGHARKWRGALVRPPGHLPVGTRRRSVRALAMSADVPVADTWRRPTSAGRHLV